MAYGDRRMRKEPGNYGPLDLFGMGLAASLGIMAAIVFDLIQKNEASALFLFNKWFVKVTHLVGLGAIPLYGVVLILMAIGAASILYFQPVTVRGAFAQGFGVLAALTTLTPTDLGGALPEATDALLPPSAQSAAPVLTPAAYTVQRSRASAAEGYDIRMRIVFTEGLDSDIDTLIRNGGLRGRLWNETTGRTYNLFRSGGADVEYRGDTIMIETRLPGEAAEAYLWARIEAQGYQITVEKFAASLGPNPVWTINMTPSRTPLFMQRLNRSYEF